MSDVSIIAVETSAVQDGVIVVVDQYAVVDSTGQPVDGKLHKDEESARAVMASMEDLFEGLEYARATFPGMSNQALRGKANAIASYLKWIKAGKPITPPKGDKVAEETPEDDQF